MKVRWSSGCLGMRYGLGNISFKIIVDYNCVKALKKIPDVLELESAIVQKDIFFNCHDPVIVMEVVT